MKRKRYTEEKIISMLKQHEGGRTMVELAREHGIAENTLYRWKSKYGGMKVSEAKRLRERQAENRPLKHFLGEAELDKAALSVSAVRRPGGRSRAVRTKPCETGSRLCRNVTPVTGIQHSTIQRGRLRSSSHEPKLTSCSLTTFPVTSALFNTIPT